MQNVVILLLVGAGGAAGAIVRYSVSLGLKSILGDAFPWGTLAVNLVGCFAFGLIASASENSISPNLKAAMGAGFLGALTTFSTFGVETIARFEEGSLVIAFANISANVGFGLMLAAVGVGVGKSLFVQG